MSIIGRRRPRSLTRHIADHNMASQYNYIQINADEQDDFSPVSISPITSELNIPLQKNKRKRKLEYFHMNKKHKLNSPRSIYKPTFYL